MAIGSGLGVINIAADRCLVVSLCVPECLFQDAHILRNSVGVEFKLGHSPLTLEEEVSTSGWLLCRLCGGFHARPLSPAGWRKPMANCG